MMRVVLASASARRRELLKLIFEEYEVIASEADEDIGLYPPYELVMRLAELKASEVFDRIKEDEVPEEGVLVIGSDTVVALDDRILGKPETERDAYSMLDLLSGRSHKVFTGVTLIRQLPDGTVNKKNFYEETVVHVTDMTSKEIEEYIATGEPMDKAGAYGIQTGFAKYVTGIEGDYNNVVGLPVARLYSELKVLLSLK